MQDIGATITNIFTNALNRLGEFLPAFIGGLVILLLGFIIASLLKAVVVQFFRFIRAGQWVDKIGDWFRRLQTGDTQNGRVWMNLLGELVRWTVIILFLIPAVDAWGVPQVTQVLNQFLLYIPNVFVAVVVGFVGFAVARLSFGLVSHATRSLGSDASHTLGNIARFAVVFFTALVILSQLGVAADLVRILFTGIVAMLAIAGGLAFGLGGQENARQAIDSLRKAADKLSS
ncbi:MAG: Conserved TM helix repeat-containing protein [Candidatus Daviesbacteria bacterium GW2011_GWA2_38_24]|uniref:Conserved TM helix repeat-containing protein n=1 Tax=Candidatus Daviesbacteria bacterium GW2011_GWA2_38_24 TaxID=1618422 RepID=A0A0G0M0X6_9BACT|nr:MAG: Conserved TM helix repeat-containing protein [Candidatus Daviesbacteria bacterium GW2011_GWA2_38_24]KKQ79755.1 MAG: Conserved TM helix repeat-containing protein [Candidatus Daviesbacteria bacterium GW2011_GWA1_38_7]OGE24451.1 MAG: hypothetical protein A2688_01030 [Candidatus Daviesbacteria bacterium RIFCSPHIGHO2_01_FULL_38_8]